MPKETTNIERSKAIRATIRTVVIHSLLPLTAFPFCIFVVPQLADSFGAAGTELTSSLRMVLAIASFISGYWPVYFLILLWALTIDGLICFRFYRSQNRAAAYLWSAFITVIEAAFVGLCAFSLIQTIITWATTM